MMITINIPLNCYKNAPINLLYLMYFLNQIYMYHTHMFNLENSSGDGCWNWLTTPIYVRIVDCRTTNGTPHNYRHGSTYIIL